MFQSLRTRLTVLFVALTVLPLAFVGIIIASDGYQSLEQASIRLQSQVAQKAAISLGAFFDKRQNELQTLTEVAGVGSLTPEIQRNVLMSLLSKQTAYYQMTVVKADGQEIARVTRGRMVTDSGQVSYAGDPLFQKAAQTHKVSFSQVHFNETARDRLVTIAVPIEDLYSGDVSSVLIAEVRFQDVEESVLRSLNLTTGEDVFVVDQNGIVVAHKNPTYVLNETHYTVPEAEGRTRGLTGDDVVLAKDTFQLGDLRMTVVSDTVYEQATALASKMSTVALTVTVFALALAGVITIFTVSRVVNPIIKLAQIAKAIQGGDYSKRSPLKRQDEIGQLSSAFNDMSDAIQQREADLLRQADELRIATAKAKEAARVKGEFLANVSHELRTPLNAIIGFSDMFLAGMVGSLTDKQHHKMERLKENGQRLLSLINDLLDLTRLEAGRLEMVQNPFSPKALAERMTAQMESLAVEGNLAFETQVSPDLPATLLGDEKRVEQVIVNLLSNAFKFTQEGSVIFAMKANLAEQTWSIEVTDTGIGIPPHAVNIIFEEFRQLDGSYSRAYKGSGLGLTITRNLVRIMGGKISVKSTLGSGSTFTVLLPMVVDVKGSVPVPVMAAA